MKSSMAALAALLFVPLAPASAQQPGTSPADGALRIYDWCMTLAIGSVSECSCVAGFYAGATAPDEFQIVSAAVPFFAPDGSVADVAGVQAAVTGMKTELGLTDERFNEVIGRFANFSELGTQADQICGPVRQRAAEPETAAPDFTPDE